LLNPRLRQYYNDDEGDDDDDDDDDDYADKNNLIIDLIPRRVETFPDINFSARNIVGGS